MERDICDSSQSEGAKFGGNLLNYERDSFGGGALENNGAVRAKNMVLKAPVESTKEIKAIRVLSSEPS